MERFYCKNIQNGSVEIIDSEARHIHSVMRLKAGSNIELFDGSGRLAKAVISSADAKKIKADILCCESFNKDTPQIIIAASISKGDRFEWMIGKCTELGADFILPVIYQRTVKQPANEKILDRWQSIIISSSKQCKRLFMPQIIMPLKFEDALSFITRKYPDLECIVGSADDDALPVNNFKFAADIAVFIGPEGGFTDDEQCQLSKKMIKKIRIMKNVLRTETAAEAFTAIISAAHSHKN